ncbi:MAG: GHKL domain-containing protein [Defluviitaleaceae bacterium]|nr:GHKL domain-containing protein [Defluviitaleaceae bacterium]
MKRVFVPFLLLIVFAAACVLFYYCYRYDNKYTAPGAQPVNGILLLDDDALTRNPVIWLIRDWELYRGSLFSPQDFDGTTPIPLPDEYIYIGQYGGFERHVNGTLTHGPHGNATYRLTIKLPPETRSYTLELPEIYSAHRLYINGLLVSKMGNPDPSHYQPRTGSGSVTVQAAGSMEIILAVSNFSHFYSGLFYPPAFGVSEAVSRILNTRMALRLIVNTLALLLGLLYLGVWLLTLREKEKPGISPLYYTGLSVCYVLYTCYPIVKTLFPGGMAWYTVENAAYCAMFLFIMLISRGLTEASKKWFRYAGTFAVFVCSWAVLMPFMAGDNLNMMMVYSRLIQWYSWVCALYLTVITAHGVVLRNKSGSAVMLVAMMVFNAALVMDTFMPLFEPIRFGWFTEIAGGFVVLMMGVVITADIARQFRLRLAMENRINNVSKMLDVQRAYLSIMEDKEEETRITRHDMRHHITMIKQLVPKIAQTEKLTAYLEAVDDAQIHALQTRYCSHDFVNILLGLYAGLARQQHTAFSVRAVLPDTVDINEVDLCVMLSNLLENALEASAKLPPPLREVSVNIGCELGGLGIFIKNRFDGVLNEKNSRFLSRKQPGRIGIGLASAEDVCKKYGGNASFFKESEDIFRARIVIPIWSGEGDGES